MRDRVQKDDNADSVCDNMRHFEERKFGLLRNLHHLRKMGVIYSGTTV